MPTTTSPRQAKATTSTTNADLALEPASGSSGISTGIVVAGIIAGLLGVALALSLVTVRYWRHTRPGA